MAWPEERMSVKKLATSRIHDNQTRRHRKVKRRELETKSSDKARELTASDVEEKSGGEDGRRNRVGRR